MTSWTHLQLMHSEGEALQAALCLSTVKYLQYFESILQIFFVYTIDFDGKWSFQDLNSHYAYLNGSSLAASWA